MEELLGLQEKCNFFYIEVTYTEDKLDITLYRRVVNFDTKTSRARLNIELNYHH